MNKAFLALFACIKTQGEQSLNQDINFLTPNSYSYNYIPHDIKGKFTSK